MKNKSSNFLQTLLFCLSISPAYAEMPIRGDGDIAGSWLLEYSSQKLNGSKINRGETWLITNGKLEKKNIRLARSGTYDVPPADYKIKDGKLFVATVGRPGKYTTFTLIERAENMMTLKEQSGSYLFFIRN